MSRESNLFARLNYSPDFLALAAGLPNQWFFSMKAIWAEAWVIIYSDRRLCFFVCLLLLHSPLNYLHGRNILKNICTTWTWPIQQVSFLALTIWFVWWCLSWVIQWRIFSGNRFGNKDFRGIGNIVLPEPSLSGALTFIIQNSISLIEVHHIAHGGIGSPLSKK